MIIFIFGNPDLVIDSLPLKLKPALEKEFSQINFIIQDPNDDWPGVVNPIILDTVIGLKRVTIIDDLTKIKNSPRLTMHDFDAGSYLKYLHKLGRINQVVIIGIPPNYLYPQALIEVKQVIANLL